MNKIVKYLKSRVIFENRIQVDWPIYLVIFLEIEQLHNSSKENLAHEAIDYILSRFLKSPTSTIVTSIQRFSELVQDRAIKLRKIDTPVNELITLFAIEYTQSNKSGNKYQHMKPIKTLQDLENKLMWYSVLMLCNQSFNIPGHSKWNDFFIHRVDHDQLSIYDSSNLNVIWESGIQFGLKLGLSLEQRFLLSHVMKLVSSNYDNYTFQNFNTVLDYILKYQYDYLEITDFSHEYFLFLHLYSTSPKKQLKMLLDDNPKGCVETMCLTLSKLSTLICTATGVAKELVYTYDVLKKGWFDTLLLLLDNVVCYYLYETHNPKDCAIVLRFFYNAIKIPPEPEDLVKPWINDYKKQVVLVITRKFHKIDIETFYEILIRFRVTVLSKVAIHDYFMKYQPSQVTSLKECAWQELMIVIFKSKDPPKSIFLSLQKIFLLHLQRNCGFDFISDCLEMDLPAHGLEFTLTKEDSIISSFKNYIEQQSRALLIQKLHDNLIQILNYIPKLRLPSLLQAIMMDALIHAIVPEQSLLVHNNKDGYCKQLIVSLQTLSYQEECTTYEQITISYQHCYLWRILALISKRIILEDLEFSNFPYMVTTLMFVFNKYCENVPGFQFYAWEDRNLVSFIEFCKKSKNIISKQYQNILNDDCSLLEYIHIIKNLTNLNELFKNCNLEILSTENIQVKTQIFTDTAKNLTLVLFLQLQIEEMDLKSSYILNFLNKHQVGVPEGIRILIESLINICYKQVTGKNEQMCIIPVLEPEDSIKLNEFKSLCMDITETFRMFTSPISEGSDCSVHKFLAHFSLRENQLFEACLRKCMTDEFQQIPEKQLFSMEEFVYCSMRCCEMLNRICGENPSLLDVECIWQIFKLEDFHQTKAHIYLAIQDCNIILKSLLRLHYTCKQYNLSNKLFYPYSISKLCDSISVLCKTYKTITFYERKIYYPIESGFELYIPENLFQVIQFLSLLPRIFPQDELDTTHTSTTLASILSIHSDILRYLNIGEGDIFFSNDLPICFEFLEFQNTMNCFFQITSCDLSIYPNVDIFLNSYSITKSCFFEIIEKYFSRELFYFQLLILKEYLDVINTCLSLYSESEPIQIESINSQIHEFEFSKSDIKKFLLFNPESSAEETSDNSLLVFLKNSSVCILKQLQDCVDLVFSEDDNITLKQLTRSCNCIKEELSEISEDTLEFISFFVTRNNILFLSLLRQKTSTNRLSHLTELQLDISQFVEYIHETYQQMHSMCIGDYTFTQVQLIPGISSVSSKDLSVIVKDFSEFPSFSTLLIDGFLSLCLFELHLMSCYLPSVVKLCENFDLRVCINNLQFKSLHKHSRNLLDLHYCEGVTISKGNQLMRDINRLINSMTISRLKLFNTLSKCREISLLFKKLDLKEGRIILENIQSNILNDPDLSEHHSLVSDNLLPVYDVLCPLFEDKINFTQLMLAYSNLHITNEEGIYLKLEIFLANINVFKSVL